MEELNNKLKVSNPMQVAQIITKTVKSINENKDGNIEEMRGFKFLKEKCFDVDPLISRTATAGMVAVIRENSSLLASILADVLTTIPNIKYFGSVVYFLNELLLIDLNNKLVENGTYKTPYNLRLPQHPFISVLNESAESWISLYSEINNTFRLSECDSRLVTYTVELYKPILLYVISNPDENSYPVFKCRLWSILINKGEVMDFLMSWMQLEAEQNIVINSSLINDFLKFAMEKDHDRLEYLIAWEVTILYKLLLHKQDPRDTIAHIKEAVEKYKGTLNCLNPLILILSKSLLHCPALYLMDLLLLCDLIIETNVDPIFIEVLKPFLLQWIANSSGISEEAAKVAQKIFFSQALRKKYNPPCTKEKFCKMVKTNHQLYTAIKICQMMDTWMTKDDIMQSLNNLDKVPDSYLVDIIYLPSLTFVSDFGDSRLSLKSLSLLVRCSAFDKSLSNYVMILILYKLSNCLEPELNMELLRTLPKLGAQKENMNIIVGTILGLSNGPAHLKTLSLSLMFDLWKNNERCYVDMEKLLTGNMEGMGSRWEFSITKANILNEICKTKAELHGKDMVAHLSKMLNTNTDEDGSLPSALAIEGISYLCKEGVIDVVTTWATLSPKFVNEKRVPVIKSLCLLFSVVPSLSYVEAYPKFVKDVVAILWDYSRLSYEPEVVAAAFDALSHFSFEHICNGFPEDCLAEETSQDSLLKSSDGFKYVSRQSWIKLLTNPGSTDLIGDFIIKVVSQEISSYLKFVYQSSKGNREPTNYSYLPLYSCVRGIGEYLRKEVLAWKGTLHEEVYLECLRIFSQKYSKPLPPFDWCFLQELIHDPKARKYSISIASRQVILSGTARRLIENYIVAMTENCRQVEDVLLIYENLENVGNSIQPLVFRPFIEKSFNRAIHLVQNQNDDTFLKSILHNIIKFLQNENVQDTNKIVVADIVKDVVDKLKVDDQLFTMLMPCIVNLPKDCVDGMTSPGLTTDLSTEWFEKAITIRCEAAKVTAKDPLNWFNDLINHEAITKMDEPYILKKFTSVFQHHISNASCALWLLEMIDETQFRVADKSSISHILFKCDIFMLAVIVFSGHSLFASENISSANLLDLFPRAAATLLDISHWSICTIQALDWFYHMNTDSYIPSKYQNIFGQALQALKHEDEFKKNLRWMKYLNCRAQF